MTAALPARTDDHARTFPSRAAFWSHVTPGGVSQSWCPLSACRACSRRAESALGIGQRLALGAEPALSRVLAAIVTRPPLLALAPGSRDGAATGPPARIEGLGNWLMPPDAPSDQLRPVDAPLLEPCPARAERRQADPAPALARSPTRPRRLLLAAARVHPPCTRRPQWCRCLRWASRRPCARGA